MDSETRALAMRALASGLIITSSLTAEGEYQISLEDGEGKITTGIGESLSDAWERASWPWRLAA